MESSQSLGSCMRSTFQTVGDIVRAPFEITYKGALWLDRQVVDLTACLPHSVAKVVQVLLRLSPYIAAGIFLPPLSCFMVTLSLFTFKAIATKGHYFDDGGVLVGGGMAYANIGLQLLDTGLALSKSVSIVGGVGLMLIGCIAAGIGFQRKSSE